MSRIAKNLVFGVVAVIPLFYVSSCSYISHSRQVAFDAVVVGESKNSVAEKFGSSFVVEKAGEPPFSRYASRPCTAPCVERWWLENRMAFDTEAWSIEFGRDGHVMRKVEWSSP